MAFGLDTIGNWTQTTLTKWIQDLLLNQPPGFLPLLKAEQIQVEHNLILRDRVTVAKEPNFRKVGLTGQPAFENSWANFGGGWQEAGFWKDPFGIVHLRGIIASGTVGSRAFKLPPGYWPALSETFPVISNNAAGQVQVLADGQVIPVSPSNNTWVSLSGITFRTT